MLEETSQDPELKEHKSAIARGASLHQNGEPFGPTFDPVFTELAVIGGLVGRGSCIVEPGSLKTK